MPISIHSHRQPKRRYRRAGGGITLVPSDRHEILCRSARQPSISSSFVVHLHCTPSDSTLRQMAIPRGTQMTPLGGDKGFKWGHLIQAWMPVTNISNRIITFEEIITSFALRQSVASSPPKPLSLCHCTSHCTRHLVCLLGGFGSPQGSAGAWSETRRNRVNAMKHDAHPCTPEFCHEWRPETLYCGAQHHLTSPTACSNCKLHQEIAGHVKLQAWGTRQH